MEAEDNQKVFWGYFACLLCKIFRWLRIFIAETETPISRSEKNHLCEQKENKSCLKLQHNLKNLQRIKLWTNRTIAKAKEKLSHLYFKIM